MPSLVKCLQLQLFELENENEVQCLTSADSNISRPSSSGGTNHKYLRLIMVIFVTGLLVLAFCSSGVFIGKKTDTYVGELTAVPLHCAVAVLVEIIPCGFTSVDLLTMMDSFFLYCHK